MDIGESSTTLEGIITHTGYRRCYFHARDARAAGEGIVVYLSNAFGYDIASMECRQHLLNTTGVILWVYGVILYDIGLVVAIGDVEHLQRGAKGESALLYSCDVGGQFQCAQTAATIKQP